MKSDPFDLQANPDPNQCLGVFGLSLYTTEKDLREVFGRYGPLAGVNVVYDQRTGRSRGFAFVYFERIADSKEVWDKQSGPLSQISFSSTIAFYLLVFSTVCPRPFHSELIQWILRR